MIENTKAEILSLLIRQHHELKEISYTVQELMGNASCSQLKELIMQLSQLTLEHIETEEETLIPLIKDMYYPNDHEIASFLQEEHAEIRKQLDVAVHDLDAVEKKFHQPYWKYTLQCILTNQLEHIFKEEQVLFPLIQRYLNRRDNEPRHLPA